MPEPALDNRSPFAVVVWPLLDVEGAEARLVLVKASFALRVGRKLPLATEPRDIRGADVPWERPDVPDLRLPAEFGLPKPGTDVMLAGHAQADPARTQRDVGLRIGARQVVLRVHGTRHWRRGLTGVEAGAAAPLYEPVPLAWSRAYGGQDLSDPHEALEESRNPVGTGVAREPTRLLDLAAPQITLPGDTTVRANGGHVPAGCAPLGRSFTPRREAAGRYDADWMASRYPARPLDYDAAHELAAPEALRFPEPLRGGERVELAGIEGLGSGHFELPHWRIVIRACADNRIHEHRPHLDTVVVDSDAGLVEMTWRGLFRVPEPLRGRFPWVRIYAKEFLA